MALRLWARSGVDVEPSTSGPRVTEASLGTGVAVSGSWGQASAVVEKGPGPGVVTVGAAEQADAGACTANDAAAAVAMSEADIVTASPPRQAG